MPRLAESARIGSQGPLIGHERSWPGADSDANDPGCVKTPEPRNSKEENSSVRSQARAGMRLEHQQAMNLLQMCMLLMKVQSFRTAWVRGGNPLSEYFASGVPLKAAAAERGSSRRDGPRAVTRSPRQPG